MYTVTMNNTGGELDSRTASTPEEACAAAIKMLTECGTLYKGDSIKIEADEADE